MSSSIISSMNSTLLSFSQTPISSPTRPRFFSSNFSSSSSSISLPRNFLLTTSRQSSSWRGLKRNISCFDALSSSSGGGGDRLQRGSGDGGDDGSNGGESEAITVGKVGGSEEEVEDLGVDDDVIVLTVGGMSCGGCAASVKRILESQVSSATVEFEKETAIVWPVPEVKVTENWQKQLGEMLANHLTTCGFKSNIRGNLLAGS